MSDLLKEAIADAKAVRETALLNAKAALEEAFTPQLKNMLSAKLVLVDETKMPKTHNSLEDYVQQISKQKGSLLLTDVAQDVKDIISSGPVPIHIKPIWPFISFMALHTLPREFIEFYGVMHTKFNQLVVEFNLLMLKVIRPFLPPFFRFIAPARWAKQRLTRNPNLRFQDKSRI